MVRVQKRIFDPGGVAGVLAPADRARLYFEKTDDSMLAAAQIGN